jgi:hypothetical protein
LARAKLEYREVEGLKLRARFTRVIKSYEPQPIYPLISLYIDTRLRWVKTLLVSK